MSVKDHVVDVLYTQNRLSVEKKIPQVSIGMPLYNEELNIREALDSMLRQTFKDFELIISDNASNDGTEAICHEYVERDSRIRYVRQSHHIEQTENFQFVLNEALGKYFMWAAADDVRSFDFIELNLKFLMENNDYIASTSPTRFKDKDFNPVSMGFFSLCDNDKFKRVIKFFTGNFHANARFYSLILRECLIKFPYKKNHYVGADWIWVIYLALNGKLNCHEKGWVKFGLYGISNTNNLYKKYNDNFILFLIPLLIMFRNTIVLTRGIKWHMLAQLFLKFFKLGLYSLAINIFWSLRPKQVKNFRSVILFRNLYEDKRISMEIYSNSLENALKPLLHNFLQINSYRPSIKNCLSKLHFATIIRYVRYFYYPNKAKKKQGLINHIIDQSYGHLLNSIDFKKTIVTVHDIIPIIAWKGLAPGLSYPHFPVLYNFSIRALRKAKAIITSSQSTKNDLITHCGLDASKMTVIYPGINKSFCSFSSEKKKLSRERFGFPDKNVHIILITGVQSYKNSLVSFQAANKLKHILNKNFQLVWLGANNEICIKNSRLVNLKNKVIPLSGLNLNQVVELYNSVDCLLFPSLYEGFGLPIIEAMACGTPVVTSNAASIPEVVGDAAIMIPSTDVDGFTVALKNILENEKLRKDYIERGYRNVSRFTWELYASKVLSLYKKILQ